MMFWARFHAHHRHYESSSVLLPAIQHTAKVSQLNIPDYTNSLTVPSLCTFLLTLPWPLQNSLAFPGFQKFKKNGNPAFNVGHLRLKTRPYVKRDLMVMSKMRFPWHVGANMVHCVTPPMTAEQQTPVSWVQIHGCP